MASKTKIGIVQKARLAAAENDEAAKSEILKNVETWQFISAKTVRKVKRILKAA